MNLRELCIEVVTSSFDEFCFLLNALLGTLLFDVLKQCNAQELLSFEEQFPLDKKFEAIFDQFYKKEFSNIWKINFFDKKNWKTFYWEKYFSEKMKHFIELGNPKEIEFLVEKYGKYIQSISITQQMISNDFNFQV
jgi:hypothetical protein